MERLPRRNLKEEIILIKEIETEIIKEDLEGNKIIITIIEDLEIIKIFK